MWHVLLMLGQSGILSLGDYRMQSAVIHAVSTYLCSACRRQQKAPHGLVNIGHTCWLNSILQGLSALAPLAARLADTVQRDPECGPCSLSAVLRGMQACSSMEVLLQDVHCHFQEGGCFMFPVGVLVRGPMTVCTIPECKLPRCCRVQALPSSVTPLRGWRACCRGCRQACVIIPGSVISWSQRSGPLWSVSVVITAPGACVARAGHRCETSQ
jgi:hypothetical protein